MLKVELVDHQSRITPAPIFLLISPYGVLSLNSVEPLSSQNYVWIQGELKMTRWIYQTHLLTENLRL